MAVKMYNEGNKLFIVCCRLANTPATWRQWKKWRKNEGLARALKGEPQRLFDVATKNLESAKLAESTARLTFGNATNAWEVEGKPEIHKPVVDEFESQWKAATKFANQANDEFVKAAAMYDEAYGGQR